MDVPKIDEAFLEISDFVQELADMEGQVGSEAIGVSMEIEKATMELPVELDIQVDDQGKVYLGAIPPMYYVETTIMPVFHQIKLKVERKK